MLRPRPRHHGAAKDIDVEMSGILSRIGQLYGFATGLGLDEETVRRIAGEVEAEAQRAPFWASIDDRLREVRRRLIEAAREDDALELCSCGAVKL